MYLLIFMYINVIYTSLKICSSGLAVKAELCLPKDFDLGAVTAAFAVEGAWKEDGKAPSIWDYLTHNHTQSIVSDSGYDITAQAEVAADSYHQWKEDVRIAQELGLTYYRFSISWPRLLPRGLPNILNQAAVDYYNNLINGLIAANISPVVTLIHYDTPLIYDQFLGGLTNDVVVNAVVEYADVAFRLFGDRVQRWVTFNSPYYFCKAIWGNQIGETYEYFPSGQYEYYCGKNVLLANARIYKLYQEKYKKTQKGKLGITLLYDWYEPASNSEEDQQGVQRALEFQIGWIAHPIVFGNYPKLMIETVADISAKQNYSKSRLPSLTDEESAEIKGTVDFFKLTPILTYIVSSNRTVAFPATFNNDVQISKKVKNGGADPNTLYQATTADLSKSIKYIYETYNHPEIYISEQGYGAFNDSLNDQYRIQFYQESLEQVSALINEDNLNIKGYSAWSLIDVYYFRYALKAKFGLVQVDFNDPNRKRTFKASAYYFKNLTSAVREGKCAKF